MNSTKDKNKHKLISFLREQWIVIIEIIILLCICVLHALNAGHYVDFGPTNGTFQNFNPIRRLLNGQIPYRDFADYLGMGHLYVGTLLTAIFGGNYQGSLVAFSFLTFLGFAIISVVIGNAIFKDKKASLAITNFVLVMILIQPIFFTNTIGLTEEIVGAVKSALGPGNSARYVRGMILPIVVFLFCTAVHIYDINRDKFRIDKIKRWISIVAIGAIAGLSFIWSNDYGISCWVCIAIMVFWVTFCRTRKILCAIVNTVVEIVASLLWLVVFVEVFTLGHLGQWLKSTFGTGGYQSWYYNSSKSFYLYDVDFSYMILLQAFIAIAYLLLLFLKKGNKEAVYRYGILGFVNMTCFCAVNEYKLLSGGASREVALAVLFLTISYETIHFVGILANKKLCSAIVILSLIVGGSYIVSETKNQTLFYLIEQNDDKYLPELGGNMTKLYDDLKSANDFLDGEKFFATYASAQEVVEGIFQPSGIDYIIHALGDEQRQEYMRHFLTDDFKYTATIRKDFTVWEYWIERANWFFYRELYQNWHPVYANTYEMYWEKNEAKDQYTISGNFDVQIVYVDKQTVKLVVRTDELINGMADIYIDYSVDTKENDQLAKLMFQKMLMVKNTGKLNANDIHYETNYLRDKSEEYIPMPISNGYGELTLTALPSKTVSLDLKQARCEHIYTVQYDFIQCNNLTDSNWTSGISKDGLCLLFKYNDNLLSQLMDGDYIVSKQNKYRILDISSDDSWIRVKVDKEASACMYPAMLEIVSNNDINY